MQPFQKLLEDSITHRDIPGKPMAIPPESDPSWLKRARPVLRFLSQPRTWVEIDAWQRQVKMSALVFTNTLAWAETRHLVRSFEREGVIHWHCPHQLPNEADHVSNEEEAEDNCEDPRGNRSHRRGVKSKKNRAGNA